MCSTCIISWYWTNSSSSSSASVKYARPWVETVGLSSSPCQMHPDNSPCRSPLRATVALRATRWSSVAKRRCPSEEPSPPPLTHAQQGKGLRPVLLRPPFFPYPQLCRQRSLPPVLNFCQHRPPWRHSQARRRPRRPPSLLIRHLR
jgi:hypothetical protein